MRCAIKHLSGGGLPLLLSSILLIGIVGASAKEAKPANAPPKVKMVDTGQTQCYNNSRAIPYPRKSQQFFGQDAQYLSNPPKYKDNGDGTVTDLVTGLMWSKAVDKKKVSLVEAKEIAKTMTLGGHSDWRVPNIKELYSLIDFSGNTGFSGRGNFYQIPSNFIPFINTDYLDFEFGDMAKGERYIDGQWLSSTEYVWTTMIDMKTLFGVNFVDGRIKGYGYQKRNARYVVKRFYARYVRGNQYGHNKFVDNGDGTVTDQVTGLTWTKKDSGKGMTWEDALKYAEDLKLGGHDDWRLPNAKELQYIVDYTRSPDTTDSPAIDPVFQTTAITNEARQKDYPCFWTSTTHLDGPFAGSMACYIAFGRAIGMMRGRVMDVHGAGAQRSDPKVGQGGLGHGPQGDARRVYNFVRCVRGGNVKLLTKAPAVDKSKYPYNYKPPTTTVSSATAQRSGSGQWQRPQMQGKQSTQNLGKLFVKRLDKDGDGKVSKEEFDGPKQHFSYFDKDKDGYLSESEAPPPPPHLRRPPRR